MTILGQRNVDSEPGTGSGEDEDDAPRRRIRLADVAGLLASCLLVVVAFFPVLFQGRTISTASSVPGVNGFAPFEGQPTNDQPDFRPDRGASAWQLEPWAEVTREAYRSGEWPFWNPYQGTGTPLLADSPSATLDPLLLPVNLHPTPRTWDMVIVGCFILGAAATYAFGRVLGLREIPSVVASSAFSLSGYFFLSSNNAFNRSYAYLPILLLLVELVIRSRRILPIAGLGVAIAGNVLVGMPETSFFVIGTAAVYALVRVVCIRKDRPMHALARLGTGLLLGIGLLLPFLVPFLQYEHLSWNSHKAGTANGTLVDSLHGVVQWLIPFAGGHDGLAGFRNWSGGAVVVLAIIGLSGRHETRRTNGWVFAGLALLLMFKIFDFGVLDWVGRLPVFDRVKFPDFAAPVLGFLLAMLAGIGAQVIWTRDVSFQRLAIVLAVSTAFAVILLREPFNELRRNVTRGYTVQHAAVAAVAGLVCLLAILIPRPKWGAVLALAAVLTELFILVPNDLWARRADPFREPGWLHLVTDSVSSRADARVFGTQGKLYPDTASALRLQDVRALDALYVERYIRYVRTFLQPTEYDRFVGGPWDSERETQPARYVGNPMFDALAVRFVIASDPQPAGLVPLGAEGSTQVFENPAAYPRSWIVHRVHAVRDEDSAFAFLRAHGEADETGAVHMTSFDPRTEAVVETGGERLPPRLREATSQSTCRAPGAEQVEVTSYGLSSVTLSASARCPGLLVLPDTYFPGWTATVNGKPMKVFATNGAFRGVPIGTGTSKVVLRYRPTHWNASIVVSLFVVVSFAAVGTALTLPKRRHAQPVPADAPERELDLGTPPEQ